MQQVLAAENVKGDRPNIVFILADDLGWTDLGVMGCRISALRQHFAGIYLETPVGRCVAAESLRCGTKSFCHYQIQGARPGSFFGYRQ